MTFEGRLEGGDGLSLADILGKNVPGGGKSRDPEVGVCEVPLLPWALELLLMGVCFSQPLGC